MNKFQIYFQNISAFKRFSMFRKNRSDPQLQLEYEGIFPRFQKLVSIFAENGFKYYDLLIQKKVTVQSIGAFLLLADLQV